MTVVHGAVRRLNWLITPPCSVALRIVIAVMLAGQGVIRVIDGRLFALTPLAYGSDLVYGVVSLSVGVFLIATIRMREYLLGQIAAALACALYLWLALAAWQTSVTSVWGAFVLAWAMWLETRAWVLRGCQ